MIDRRRFLTASALGSLAPNFVRAQQKRVRIGVLGPAARNRSVYAPGILRRLSDLGYRDIEYRSSDGVPEIYIKQARELAAMKCDLAIAIGTEQAARALQDARAPMPIVFLAVDYDPVEKGIVGSLRKPDRNTTGIYVPQNELVAKRIEIAREALPASRRMMVLADEFSRDQVETARTAAAARNYELTVIDFPRRPYDYPNAFEAGRKADIDVMMTLSSPVFAIDGAQLAKLASKHRVPAIAASLRLAEFGFLLAYYSSLAKLTRRVAEVGARILQGARSEDIPVEQVDEFELVVNAVTAKTLGVRIPESIMARATRIIS